ncbi:unnamed protein product [Scytosiphon promiscuus]
MVALNHGASKEDRVRPPTVERGSSWQGITEDVTIESRLQQIAQTGPTKQDRHLLYVDMVKRTNAVVSTGVQSVPAETLRAIVETFERSVHAAAMISSGEGAVLRNPVAVRQPAVARGAGSRAKSSSEFGGAASRRKAQSR